MALINIFLILSIFFLCLYIIGIGNFLLNHEKNLCSMTYMYEFPQFIKINVTDDLDFDKYGLYAYSEGRLTEKARNLHFDGIPVLFIPGNAGSYKQVRSLASVGLRKYLNSRSRYHFDYFTVDLNGEYSGLYGGVLKSQSQFVNLSINSILNLYDKRSLYPKSVVLIGHSMGGLIAQNVLTLDENSQRVNTIITLATPNKNPIATLDYLIPRFYTETFEYWDGRTNKIKAISSANEKKNNFNNSDILFISIGGGFRDVLVPSGLTFSRFGHINTLTTAIPMVWLSTDHQCIVWCLQLVLVLNRVLFNMVDKKSKQISTNFDERFETSSGLLTIATRAEQAKLVHFRKNAEWHEDNRRLFSVEFMNGLNQTRYQMIRLLDSNLHQMLAVEVLNLDDDDWIFGCSANDIKGQSRVCEKGLSLSNYTRPHPSLRYKRHIAYLDLHKIKRQNPSWSHVIFQISPTNDHIQLNFDIYNRDQRILKASSPRFFSFTKSEVIADTLAGVMHYDLIISDFNSLYQALHLYVEPKQCSRKAYHSVSSFYVPWAPGHTTVHYFTEQQIEPMRLRLHQQSTSVSTKNVRIRFVLDPNCKYSISLKSSFLDVLGQTSRHYSLHLIPYIACILILALREQILQVKNEKKCSNLLSALTSGAKPYYVVTIAKFAQKFVSSDPAVPILLPLLSFLVAWGMIYILGLIVYIGIAVAGKFAHTVMLRIISFGAVNTLKKLPLAMGVVTIAFGIATCGSASLLAAVLIYSIILCKMYEDYTDSLVSKTIKNIARKIIGKTSSNEKVTDKTFATKESLEVNYNEDKQPDNVTSNQNHDILNETTEKIVETEIKTNNEKDNSTNNVLNKAVDIVLPESDITLSVIHFNITIFLIILLAALLNFSSFLTWSNNFKYAPHLENDPTIWFSMIICICLSIMWQIEVPKPNVLFSVELGYILYALSIGCLIFSNIALYTINYFLTSAIILISVHQCMPYFGFKECLSVEGESNETSQLDNEEKTAGDDEGLTNKVKIIRTKLQEE